MKKLTKNEIIILIKKLKPSIYVNHMFLYKKCDLIKILKDIKK